MKNLLYTFLLIAIAACQTNSATDQSREPKAVETKEKDQIAPDEKRDTIKNVPVTKATRISKMPDFTVYTDVKEKKKAFFDFLRPMVDEENNRIKAERSRIESLYAAFNQGQQLSAADSEWIITIAEQMRIKSFDITNESQRNDLLCKVDIVPPSLFLAQAANESSWGTSRFAREANNLFGQWCFSKGCGIVPAQRAANETHEVQKFATVNDAVNSYVRNINGHNAYKQLRTVRLNMRNEGKVPTGEALAVGLTKYSARGEEYVKEIQSMIRVNKLERSN